MKWASQFHGLMTSTFVAVQDVSGQDVTSGHDDTGTPVSLGELIAQQDPSALPFAIEVSSPAAAPALVPAPGPAAAAPVPAPLGAIGKRLLQDSGGAAGKPPRTLQSGSAVAA